MKRMRNVVLAVLLMIGMTAGLFGAQAESGGSFQPRLDRDTACETR